MKPKDKVVRCREDGTAAVLTWAKMHSSDADGWTCPVCGRTWAGV